MKLNRDEVIKLIKNKNKIPGIVLHSIYDYPDIESCLKGFEQVLILSIEKPGSLVKNFMKNLTN